MRCVLTVIACAWLCTGCSPEPVPLPPVPAPSEAQQRLQEQQSARQLAEMVAQADKAYRDAIHALVGDEPVRCNGDRQRPRATRVWEASPQQLADWFRCVEDARAAGRPFVISLEHPVDDGRMVTGVLGSRDGVLRAFSYSHDCCGGARGHLEAGPCEAPTAQRRHPGQYGVRCRNEDVLGRVPTPELWSREAGLSPELSAQLLTLAGDGAIDCGFELSMSPYFRQASRFAAALGCMRSAEASGRASWVLVPIERAGSLLVHGLVRQPSGVVKEVVYAAPPGGSPGRPAAIEVNECAQSRVVRARDGGTDFLCEPTGRMQTRQ